MICVCMWGEGAVPSYNKLYNVDRVARDETGEKTGAKSWNPSNDTLNILKFILKAIKSSEMFHVRERCQEHICILYKACMYILNKK